MAEYIDREALFAEFDRLGLGEHSIVEKVFSDGVRTIIAGVPAADVAPVVHGQWRANRLNGYDYSYACSNCGMSIKWPYDGRHRYCPNCGAKMDGADALGLSIEVCGTHGKTKGD